MIILALYAVGIAIACLIISEILLSINGCVDPRRIFRGDRSDDVFDRFLEKFFSSDDLKINKYHVLSGKHSIWIVNGNYGLRIYTRPFNSTIELSYFQKRKVWKKIKEVFGEVPKGHDYVTKGKAYGQERAYFVDI